MVAQPANSAASPVPPFERRAEELAKPHFPGGLQGGDLMSPASKNLRRALVCSARLRRAGDITPYFGAMRSAAMQIHDADQQNRARKTVVAMTPHQEFHDIKPAHFL